MLDLKIIERRKRGRRGKQWIDVVEEDMRKRGVSLRQDAGDRDGWRKREVQGLHKPG